MNDKKDMERIFKKFQKLCKKYPIKIILIKEFKRK